MNSNRTINVNLKLLYPIAASTNRILNKPFLLPQRNILSIDGPCGNGNRKYILFTPNTLINFSYAIYGNNNPSATLRPLRPKPRQA